MKYLLICSILLSSNLMAQENANERVMNLIQLKTEVEMVLPSKPYHTEEHTAIKKYFVELETLNQDLVNFPRYFKRFNNFIRRKGLENFCKDVFLDKTNWSELAKNCTKNSFFLCTEKVREYPEYKKILLEKMPENLKAQLEKNSYCW